MPRYSFFSFCYEDVKNFKVNVVRNSWLLNHSADTFIDGSIWEKEKSNGSPRWRGIAYRDYQLSTVNHYREQ
jgi:hypothetical protein